MTGDNDRPMADAIRANSSPAAVKVTVPDDSIVHCP